MKIPIEYQITKKIILQLLFYDNGNVSILPKNLLEAFRNIYRQIEKFLNNFYYFCFCFLCINETAMISMIVSECVIDHDQREVVKE